MPIKVHFLCKRHYTNKDLLKDRFGRLFHLPVELVKLGMAVSVSALDYRSRFVGRIQDSGVVFRSVPATLLSLPSIVLELYRIIAYEAPDVLVASGDSHIGFLGKILSKRLKAQFVFDVYDYYPSFRGNKIPGMKSMFHSAVRHADLLLCASKPLQDSLVQFNRNTLLIYNGVDSNLFKPMDKKMAREKLGINQSFVCIGYFGSITPTRGPLLLEACRKLKERSPSLRLLLAGAVNGVSIDEPWIIYHGVLPQEAIPERIAACDVVTIPYSDDLFNRMSGACKIAEYMACERPVVATDIAGHGNIFGSIAFSVCKPNSEAMKVAIKHHLRAPEIASCPSEMKWEVIGKLLYKSIINTFAQRN